MKDLRDFGTEFDKGGEKPFDFESLGGDVGGKRE
jgi:hypothetical protein